MAKFASKLGIKEVEELFYKLSAAISGTKSVKEAAEFLRDMLSYQEAEMIAKRLKIAELLLEGKTYDEIRNKIKVSFGTIARVQEWLKLQGDGYRRAVQNTKGKSIAREEPMESEGLTSIKKRYPQYYWPEILLENIIKNSNKRQKQKIKNVISQLEKMKEKNKLYVKLKRLVRY